MEHQRLVACISGKDLIVWNYKTRSQEPFKFDRINNNNLITTLVARDQNIIVASKDKTVGIFQLNNEKSTIDLQFRIKDAHTDLITTLHVPSDKKFIISISRDTSIKIHPFGSRLKQTVSKANARAFTCLAVAQDSSFIVAGSADRSLSIYNSENMQMIFQQEACHHQAISCVAATTTTTPDCLVVVSGGKDGTVVVWRFESSEKQGKIEFKSKEALGEAQEDSKAQRDSKAQKDFKAHSGEVTAAVISRKGDILATASMDRKIIIVIGGKKEEISNREAQSFTALALADKAQLLIAASLDLSVRVWDVATRELKYNFPNAHQARITSVVADTQAEYILAASQDQSIAVWTKTAFLSLDRLNEAHESWITALICTNDSSKFVSASADCSIKVWNSDNQTKSEIYIPDAHTDQINCLAFASKKQYIISSSADKTIKVWDLKTLATKSSSLSSLSPAPELPVVALAVTPDYKTVVSALSDQSICYYLTDLIKTRPTIRRAHDKHISTVAVSSDGSRIVSGSWDKTIKVWNIVDGTANTCLATFADWRVQQITTLSITPKADYIAFGTWNRMIGVWNVQESKLQNEQERRFQFLVPEAHSEGVVFCADLRERRKNSLCFSK